MKSHDATFYVQVSPEWSRYADYHTGLRTIEGLKAGNLTQKRPAQQRGGTALVCLTIRIPDAAFLPLRPKAVIVIPEDMVTIEPIVVEAGDPS